MRILTFTLLACLGCLPVHSQFKGKVYIDENRSGVYDKGDTPLVDVSVTDGRNVVKTDKKGRFSLPGYEKTRFITLTTPAGYEAKQFYLPVTPGNTGSYDFQLLPSKRTKAEEHTFLQITDTEVTGGLGRWVTDLKNYVANEKPAFVIHTGDICYEAGQRMHIRVVNAGTMGCPVYYCIGNHDLVKGKYGEELYESLYGPTWYSFDVGNVHYVVTPMSHGDFPSDYTQRDVYEWLKNDLALMRKDQALVLFNHDLFTAGDNFVFRADKEHILDLRPYNAKAEIYGHMHYNYVRNQKGIYTICTATLDKGGIDHSPSAFREIHVDAGNNLSTCLRYTFIEPRISLLSPSGEVQDAAGGKLPLSVNTYCSQAKTQQVSYLLKNKADNKEIARGNLRPCTDWNWADEISLPASLPAGQLELTVTSRFTNGKTAVATHTFACRNQSPSVPQQGGDWTTLLGNAAHTGGINSSDVRLPLQTLWVANAGSNIFMTSPLIAEGKVFVATTDDNVSLDASLCAFDLQSGKLLWKYATENSVKNTIAYEDGLILAQDAACNLYAVNASSGSLAWKKTLDMKAYPYLTEGLTVDKGVVYAGIGSSLSAYELKTGCLLWINREWTQREGATTTLTVAGNSLVSGTQWGGLYANDIRTGKLLWKLTEDGLRNRGASPVYRDGQLWLLSAKSLFVIEPETGKVVRQKELSANVDVTSTPLVTDNEVIFGTADRGIMALDKETFFVKWKAETHPSLVYTAPYSTSPQAGVETSPVASQGIVYVGASDGYLYALDQSTGIIKEKIDLGAPIFSTPALSGKRMVVCDFAGNVYSFGSR